MISVAFADLKNRVLLSLMLVSCVFALIFFAYLPIVQFVITSCLACLSAGGIWEYSRLVRAKGIEIPVVVLSVLAGCFVFATYLSLLNIGLALIVRVVIVAFFFLLFFYHFYKIDGAIQSIAVSLFGACYIAVPLTLMLKILYPTILTPLFQDGRVWLAYLIAVTKISDIGGYFAGKLWGKAKIAPHISPGKTFVGSFVGILFSVIMSLIFAAVGGFFPAHIFSLGWGTAICLGAFIGVFGFLGDLAESLLKRDASVKDSNNLPGIGGILDLLDSLLFTAPILYLYLKTL